MFTKVNLERENTQQHILYLKSKGLWKARETALARMSASTHVCVLVVQLCPTLCDPMDRSLPASSVHGILQARILEWIFIPFSRGSSQPRDQTQVSLFAG